MLYHCQTCGKPFEAAPAAKRKYCSRKCMGKAYTKKVERVCQACGETFLAKRHKVKEGKALYCSRDCADTGWDEPCAHCGDPVHRTPFHAERFDNAFCSRRCYGEWKRDHVERECGNCGKAYSTKPSTNTVYCSQECFDEARSAEFVQLICEQCGEGFVINAWLADGRQFCSNECRGVARRLPDAVRSKYNHEFTEKLRERIRERDNRTCQICGAHSEGTRRALDVHHVNYNKRDNRPKNLITLCDSCHPKTNYNRDKWQGRLEALMNRRFPAAP